MFNLFFSPRRFNLCLDPGISIPNTLLQEHLRPPNAFFIDTALLCFLHPLEMHRLQSSTDNAIPSTGHERRGIATVMLDQPKRVVTVMEWAALGGGFVCDELVRAELKDINLAYL